MSFSVSSVNRYVLHFSLLNENGKAFLMRICSFPRCGGFLIPYVLGLPVGEAGLPVKGGA